MDQEQLTDTGEKPIPAADLPVEFEVLETLGHGGAGSVYRCRQRSLDRTVAVKVLRKDCEMTSAPERFRREAQVLASLDHPNIQKVFGWGLEPVPHLISEFIEGQTLTQVMKQGLQTSGTEFARIFVAVAEGLEYIESKGIVHRDLKPGNIIVQKSTNGEPVPRIIDFGLAHIISSEKTSDQKLTSTAAIVGSPLYMSPEQCTGGTLSPKSDVFSLGCIMYEFLSGRPPFEGDSEMETMYLRTSSKALPLSKTVQVPRKLENLIERCLEHDAARRPSASEVLTTLSACKTHDFRIKRTGRRRFIPIAACTLAIAATSAIALVTSNKTESPKSSDKYVFLKHNLGIYLKQSAERIRKLQLSGAKEKTNAELAEIWKTLDQFAVDSDKWSTSEDHKRRILYSIYAQQFKILQLGSFSGNADTDRRSKKEILQKIVDVSTIVPGNFYVEAAEPLFQLGEVFEDEVALNESADSFLKAVHLKEQESSKLGKRLSVDAGTVTGAFVPQSLDFYRYRYYRIKLRQGDKTAAPAIVSLIQRAKANNGEFHTGLSVAMTDTLATYDMANSASLIRDLEKELRAQARRAADSERLKNLTAESYLALSSYYVQDSQYEKVKESEPPSKLLMAEQCVDHATAAYPKPLSASAAESIWQHVTQISSNYHARHLEAQVARIDKKYAAIRNLLQ